MAILTPGIYNSAYYEHALLAGEMGVELVEGQDLAVRDGMLFARTIAGLERIDVLYRRVTTIFLDPVTFRPDSALGRAGMFHAYRSGNVVLANAPGTGVADDKSLYATCRASSGTSSTRIRSSTTSRPIFAASPRDSPIPSNHLDELVVKEGRRLRRLRDAGRPPMPRPRSARSSRKRLRADPANFISQPTLDLSRAPCFVDGRIEPRHVDLRPFVLQGRDRQEVVAGGLCRVALRRGSLVVNSSQGGGCKDLWVLEG